MLKNLDKIKKIAIFSTFINVFLFVIKYYVGFRINSVAIISDSWHTLSDSITSGILFFSAKIAGKPPDSRHPFGHGRSDIISSLIIGFILVNVGFHFLHKSYLRFLHHEGVHYGTAAIVITIISIILKEVLAEISIKFGKKFESRALIADGWHHRSDSLSSFLILIGIFINPYFARIDSILGCIVSIIILIAAYDLIKKSVSNIIGEEIDPQFQKKIENTIAQTYNHPLKTHHFHLHDYGMHKELTFHIKLAPDTLLKDAHKLADKIEKSLKEKYRLDTTIHVEPENKND